jgi:hypothetical protein
MWKKICFCELSDLKSIREGESVPHTSYESMVEFSKDMSLRRVDFGGAERVYTYLGRQKNNSHEGLVCLF